MVGDLPHSLFLHVLHLSHHFPRLSCCFFSLPCSDLLIFPIVPLFLSLLGIFSPFFHLSWLFPTPPHSFLIVCQMQDIQWPWPTRVFAAALWMQKRHSGHRSCCFLVILYTWVTTSRNRSALRTKGEWKRDFEAVSYLSIVQQLWPQWVGMIPKHSFAALQLF